MLRHTYTRTSYTAQIQLCKVGGGAAKDTVHSPNPSQTASWCLIAIDKASEGSMTRDNPTPEVSSCPSSGK